MAKRENKKSRILQSPQNPALFALITASLSHSPRLFLKTRRAEMRLKLPFLQLLLLLLFRFISGKNGCNHVSGAFNAGDDVIKKALPDLLLLIRHRKGQ